MQKAEPNKNAVLYAVSWLKIYLIMIYNIKKHSFIVELYLDDNSNAH